MQGIHLPLGANVPYPVFTMASLTLADGTVFAGQSFGAPVDADGEVVFSTGMVGYPDSMTDPSYRGQILVFTFPLIGNYGVPSEAKNRWGFSEHFESEDIHVRGIVVAWESRDYSHCQAVSSLHEWMVRHGVPGIAGIDTRSLTKKLREHGVMLGRLAQRDPPSPFPLPPTGGEGGANAMSGGEGGRIGMMTIEDPNVRNLVAEVSCKDVHTYEPELGEGEEAVATIVVYDCGVKRGILRSLLKRKVTVHRVPWDYDLKRSQLQYDGVVVSNGPGDPTMCKPTVEQIRWALKEGIPFFGICLGNQLMALAIGGRTYKLKYGHRGANQPCIDELSALSFERSAVLKAHSSKLKASSRCIITSQNHGFAVSDKLPAGWHVWFTNANDGTVEGIRHASGRFFSVQFHPEATPGPQDADELFDEFLQVVAKEAKGVPRPLHHARAAV